MHSSVSQSMDIAINLIFEDEPNIDFTNHELQKLFQLRLEHIFFLMEILLIKRMVCQLDFPQLLLSTYGFSGNWIEKTTPVKQVSYQRYVDDIFAVLQSKQDTDSFCTYYYYLVLDIKKNIKFTSEKQEDNDLLFLVMLTDNEAYEQASMFHKKAYRDYF